MVEIAITSHNFKKINLVSIRKGKKIFDILKCSDCGLEGKRYGFTETVCVKRDKVNCSFRKKIRSSKVAIFENPHLESEFGLKCSIFDVVEPPEEYKGKYPESVWVFSEKRGEPVRLLPGEFAFTGKS